MENYTFNQLDKDLKQFEQLCRNNGIESPKKSRILQPLSSKICKRRFPQISLKFWLISIVTLIVLAVLVTKHQETLSWHVAAITRIAMIEILPYFDWTYLKDESCIMPMNKPSQTAEAFECDLCESLISFDNLVSTTYQPDLRKKVQIHIDLDEPLIVTGSIDDWLLDDPKEFIDKLIADTKFVKSKPCNLHSNLHNSRKEDADLGKVLKRGIESKYFFIHFQNCQKEAVKVFKNFTTRPKGLPDELAPVTYSWLIWNKDYESPKYKALDLIERHTVFGQMHGRTHLRLIPRKNCQDICPTLEGTLKAGQMIIITSLWDIEYLPDKGAENLASILEIK